MKKTQYTVTFEEEAHKYHNELGQEYISCTTLIGLYKPKFDEKYWSTYKAVKDVLSKYNEFKLFKIQAGGWENVPDYWETSPVRLDEVLDRKNYYVELWEKEKNDACEKGTKEHLIRENAILEKPATYGSSKNTLTTLFPLAKTPIMDVTDDNYILPEALVWNDEYMIAGQVDLVEKEGLYLDIKDYKTNKEIAKKPFMNATMHHPLSQLPDANFYHYQLQMSLYGWMLEQQGYIVRSLELIHITGEGDVKYEVEYVPGLIERMINHYAKSK